MSETGSENAQPGISNVELHPGEGFISRTRSAVRRFLGRGTVPQNQATEIKSATDVSDRTVIIDEQLKDPNFRGPGIAKLDFLATGQNPGSTGEKVGAENDASLSLPQRGELGYIPPTQTVQEQPVIPTIPPEHTTWEEIKNAA